MSLRSAAELARNPELMRPPEIIAPPVGVAGRVTLLALPPKGGKSTSAAGIIRDASHAGLKCGLLSLDEALADSLQRLGRVGAVMEHVYLDDAFEPAALAEQCAMLDLDVLVLDHLGKLAEQSADFGANSQGDSVLWGRLVSPFTTLARDTNLAVILLDQARRADGEWSGSVGKGGNVDVIAVLRPKDGGLVCTPAGRIRIPPFRIDLDAEGRPVFAEQDEGAPTSRAYVVTEANRRAVLELLRNAEPDGLRTHEWARLAKDAHGIARASFYRIRKDHMDGARASYASRLYRLSPTGERYLNPPVSIVPEVPVIPLRRLERSQQNGIRSLTHIECEIPERAETLGDGPLSLASGGPGLEPVDAADLAGLLAQDPGGELEYGR